jgi:hypothetical protein
MWLSKFCKVLKEGLKDETSADRYYARLNTALREQARTDYPVDGETLRRDLNIIDRIRDDEQGHKIALTALYNRRCT